MVSGWRRSFKNQDPTTYQYCDYDYDYNSPNFSFSTTTPKRNTSSPNSPFSLLKATLRLSRVLCGICTQSVKTGQGKAIFTAECSHTFHFPCIAAHVRNHQMLTCPVCSTNWKQLQTAHHNTTPDLKTTKSFKLHTYNDDEPLMSPTSVSRFNPIPESNENEEDEEDQKDEPIGLNVSSSFFTTNIDLRFSPEAAIMPSNRSFKTYVALLKVKAPPCNSVVNRPPVDLVTVVDIGGNVSGEDLQMLKHSMQIIVSSLGSADRLSVVAFSGGSKRLFPLRRMTGRGQTAARRVVDAIQLRRDGTPARNDALKKAAKVLEDRRQKNPVARIILLTRNTHVEERLPSTRFAVHSLSYSLDDASSHAQQEIEFAKRVECSLSVVAHDLKLELRLASRSAPAEIAAVYSVARNGTSVLSPDSVALGDLYAAEERELLVELKVPAGTLSRGSHQHVISVRSSHRDPFTQELVNSKEREFIVPRPHMVRSRDATIERLRSCYVTARAVAESRRLVARNDVYGAFQLLYSARTTLMQWSREESDECLRWLKAEQAELRSLKLSSNNTANNCLEEKRDPLTPMSAWRVAETLAKVAIMRKSMNRVSDLHGFEDARF
ncbi:hypothetical protein RJT34_02314 [Clitoria ternatea]|uniref:Uncharacterized protein n=1 Tax=Clitoria ternatea TaxID=43366 RepID=A0AAN9KKC3_CLITE